MNSLGFYLLNACLNDKDIIKIKVSVAIKKQVKQKTYKSNLVGVDVGITDLIYTSNLSSK